MTGERGRKTEREREKITTSLMATPSAGARTPLGIKIGP